MRVGLGWETTGDDAGAAWQHVVAEAVAADGLGYDSVWIRESRDLPASVSSPAVFLTYLSRLTKTVQLRAVRLLTHANPVRVAEEMAVLDVFSRGRAGLALAAAAPQRATASLLHETHDFVTAAWALDEIRYRGEHIRFPSHTPDDAPRGATTPAPGGRYVPQWERGPATSDYLAITPKPYASMPPTNVDISDDETLEWAARSGVSPLVPATTPTEEAVEQLSRYRGVADAAGRRRAEVEPVIERYIAVDGAEDPVTLGGRPAALVERIREVALASVRDPPRVEAAWARRRRPLPLRHRGATPPTSMSE